jgi:hypothetical protein
MQMKMLLKYKGKNMKSSLIRVERKLPPKKLEGISSTHSLLAPAVASKVKQRTQAQQ